MYKGKVKQILLLTDGCSNHGEDPIAMASLAREYGITINVIGILDEDHLDERAQQEIESISAAGGGISQIVYAKQLSQTVQMVTRKAMTQTLQGLINKELQNILGKDKALEDLPPDKRGEVIEVVDELGETVDLQVLILIDTSASMTNKLPTVKEALLDLSLSLNARMGDNEFAAFIFPGKNKEVEKVLDWTPNLRQLTSVFPKLVTRGLTPTGPALKEALAYFNNKRTERTRELKDEYDVDSSGM
ncbi:MAG: VWA domain-containing protein [Ectobacillus sp.]